MIKFEVGKVYETREIGDSKIFYKITVISRTDKTVTFQEEGEKKRRCKIFTLHYEGESEVEFISPDNYSMGRVFRANRELINN